MNLRFPGQYYDAESGLHYNWNRYYSPAIGRYISSDPIGVDGGLNTYNYADASPVMYADPEDDNDPQKKGRPQDPQKQNKQVRDAANSVGLNNEQRRQLGREVEYESRELGRNLGYKDIEQIAKEIKNGNLERCRPV